MLAHAASGSTGMVVLSIIEVTFPHPRPERRCAASADVLERWRIACSGGA
jgi:hypothetical protein